MNTAALSEPQTLARKAKRSDTFVVFFSQSVCYFCSLVMLDCDESGLSDSGIDWVEEPCRIRAIRTILPRSGKQ